MNQAAYIKGYMSKMAGFQDVIKSILSGKGFGLGADTAGIFSQGPFANHRFLRSAVLGAIPGAAINLYRNWDNEEQSRWKSLLYGAGTGAGIGLGYQALFPNALKYVRPAKPAATMTAPALEQPMKEKEKKNEIVAKRVEQTTDPFAYGGMYNPLRQPEQ